MQRSSDHNHGPQDNSFRRQLEFDAMKSATDLRKDGYIRCSHIFDCLEDIRGMKYVVSVSTAALVQRQLRDTTF